MNVGIISCYGWLMKTGNYGTLMQNWALQTILQRLGCQTTWLAVAPHANSTQHTSLLSKVQYVLSHPTSIHRKIKEIKQTKKQIAFYQKYPRKIEPFLDKYVPHTPYIPLQELEKQGYLQDIDVYIVGSDNVWENVNDIYFLGFAENTAIKLAYAASAPWAHLEQDWPQKAAPYLKKFQGISVRESAGIDLIDKTGCHAEHVLDPTLLLNKEDYLKLTQSEADSPAIFAYVVNNSQALLSLLPQLENISRQLAIPLRIAALQNAEYDIPANYYCSPTPTEWIKNFANAPFIVTNSFHGMAFSIIMQKPFVVLPQSQTNSKGNSRFSSLLGQLGLENHILREKDQLENIVKTSINWKSVDQALSSLQQKSIHWLSQTLSLQ